MDLTRHLLSAGGFIANLLNQRGPRNWSNDRVIRPSWMFIFEAVGLVFAWACWGVAVGYQSGGRITPPSSEPWLQLALAALSLAIVALMNAGWYVGLVPFVALAPQPNALLPGTASEIDLEVGVTGVVEDALGERRRYRDRPARLTGATVTVRPWWDKPMYRGSAPVHPDLCTFRGTDLVRGTAFLVTAEKPAIRFSWKYGHVILTFRSTAERDVALEFLSALWQRSGTTVQSGEVQRG